MDWMFEQGGAAPQEPLFDAGPDMPGFAYEPAAKETFAEGTGAAFEWSPEPPVMTEGIDDPIIIDGWMDGFVTNTMTGDVVDDIIVIGDRENPEIWNPHDGPVPGNGGGMGGNGGGGSGGQGPTTDGLPVQKNCEIDDKAREALQLFKDNAQADGLNWMHNERGVFIVRNPDGTLGFANLRVGPSVFSAEGAQVPADTAGLDPLTIVGWVHSHPSDGTMQAPDRGVLDSLQRFLWQHGALQELRMYIVNTAERLAVWDLDSSSTPEGLDVTEDC